jgi:hypothetical protein
MKMRCVKLLLVVFCIAAFSLPVVAGAADASNKGFKGEVSTVLKERFSMCDEFLDVKWVDRARRTGLMKVEAYRNGAIESRFLIVHLEKPGSKAFRTRGSGIFYEISEQEYNSPAFAKSLSRRGHSFKHHNVFMYMTKSRKSERYPQEPLPFEAFNKHRNEFPNRSFSGFSRTVCVAYPGEKQVFVIEAKKPFAVGSHDKGTKQAYDMVSKYARERCAAISKGGSDCNRLSYLKDSYALNINGDGKDDYIFVISGSRGSKSAVKRYMLLSSGDGYRVKDVTGCLGFGRFFYGYANARSFHLGSCAK